MANYNQDAVMENIMLFSPTPVLQAIQDSYMESILADMQEEDTEIFVGSVPVHKSGKSRKSRRAIRIACNKRKKGSDRAHGKRHGKKYLDNLPRKKYLEADSYDHPTYRIVNGKLRSLHNMKQQRADESAQSQFDHTPFDEDVWGFVGENHDPLNEERMYDYWKSPSDFCITTKVVVEAAKIIFSMGHYVLVETGTVFYEDEYGSHGTEWERETVIY